MSTTSPWIEQIGSRLINETDTGVSLVYKLLYKDSGLTEVVKPLLPQMGTRHAYLPSSIISDRDEDLDHTTLTGRLVEQVTDQVCRVELTYSAKVITAGDEVWEYDYSAQQRRITHVMNSGLQTHYPVTYDSPSTAIGVDEGRVEGCDVFRFSGQLTVTKEFSYLASSWHQTIRDLSGKVNDDEWPEVDRTYKKGEVLFVGAVIRKPANGNYQVQYKFMISPNVENSQYYTVDGGFQSIDTIYGWDYVWFTNAQIAGATEGAITTGVRSVHVAQVYEFADFSNLSLEGPPANIEDDLEVGA